MPITKNEIPEILALYKKYSDYMQVRPILTFSRKEQKMAIGNRYDDIISQIMTIDIKKAKYYNKKYYDRSKNVFGQTDYKRNGYNDVIFLDLDKFSYLYGLHTYTDWQIIPKRKLVYKTRHKIGHLEETLIHELLHVKYPNLKHGDKFNQIVKDIYLKNNSV